MSISGDEGRIDCAHVTGANRSSNIVSVPVSTSVPVHHQVRFMYLLVHARGSDVSSPVIIVGGSDTTHDRATPIATSAVATATVDVEEWVKEVRFP